MEYFSKLEEVLLSETPTKKIELFQIFYKLYKENKVVFDENYKVKYFTQPSYINHCRIIAPQNVPKRTNLTSNEGQIKLLHAILHIEYSAIDLALDAAYRFKNMPREYYDDWLEVAEDEVRHYQMLEILLNELGASYGDIEVHNALFEASQKTQTLLERMAVVPRYLEANGLDATPMILKKIQKLASNNMLEKIVTNLHIILEEEISHVKKGDKWFKYACQVEKKEEKIYFEIVDKYYPRGFLRVNDLNIDARKEAGFSCQELNYITKKEIC